MNLCLFGTCLKSHKCQHDNFGKGTKGVNISNGNVSPGEFFRILHTF